jgi:hypothetical protein
MQDAVDFEDVLADPIQSQEGQAGEHDLSGIRLTAGTATVWKLREGAYTFVDCERHTAGRCRALCSSM